MWWESNGRYSNTLLSLSLIILKLYWWCKQWDDFAQMILKYFSILKVNFVLPHIPKHLQRHLLTFFLKKLKIKQLKRYINTRRFYNNWTFGRPHSPEEIIKPKNCMQISLSPDYISIWKICIIVNGETILGEVVAQNWAQVQCLNFHQLSQLEGKI